MSAEMEIKIESNVAEFKRALVTQVDAALEAIGQQAEGHAKLELENRPHRVDTGLLRNSITYAVDGKSAHTGAYRGSEVHGKGKRKGKPAPPPHEGSYSGTAPKLPEDEPGVYIGTNVEYATYVHDGTSRMTANRFLKKAVTKYGKEYEAIAKLYLEGGG